MKTLRPYCARCANFWYTLLGSVVLWFVCCCVDAAAQNRLVSGTFPQPTLFAESDTVRVFLPPAWKYRPRIALVLSGGGARGIAHVGVLKALERAGVKIDYIVGTSMGAIVGGLYASGYSAGQLDSILSSLDWNDVVGVSTSERERTGEFLDQRREADRSLLTVRLKGGKFTVPEAVSTGYRFTSTLYRLLNNGLYAPEGNFNSLKYPFRAVATDIAHGKSVALKSGNLSQAIRASATIPLRFMPVQIDSMLLVDGGLLANIPVEAAREFAPDIILAVNTTSPLLPKDEINSAWTLADQVVTTMIRVRSEQSLQQADIVFEPLKDSLQTYSSSDFDNAAALIPFAEHQTERILPALLSLIQQKHDSLYATHCAEPVVRSSLPLLTRSAIGMAVRSSLPASLPASSFAELSSAQRRTVASNHDVAAVQSLKLSQLAPVVFPTPASALEHALHVWRILSDQAGTYHSGELRFVRCSDTARSPEFLQEQGVVLRGDSVPRIHAVVVRGAHERYTKSIDSLCKQWCGLQASENILQQLTECVTAYYRKQSNSAARARVEELRRDTTTGKSTVFLVCAEYPVRRLVIQSDDSLITFSRRNFIRRELHVPAGATFSAEQAAKDWRGLMATNLFTDVLLDTRAQEDGSLEVTAYVRERGAQFLRLGGRIDNERNTQLGLDAVDENFFDTGLRASLRLAGGLRNLYGIAALSVPRVWGSPFTLSVRGYGERLNMYSYQERPNLPLPDFERFRTGEFALERLGGKVSITRDIERSGYLLAELRYEWQRSRIISRIDPTAFEPQSYSPIATLKIGARFDSQDRADFPTSGRVLDISFELPAVRVAGNDGFSKAVFEYQGVMSLSAANDHVIRPSCYFGFSDLTLPTPELFSLGGEDTFYGMREDEQRGRQIMRASLEYRYRLPVKIIFDTYFSLRYDVGSTANELGLLSIGNIRHGMGLAVGVDTPFGPGRISLGRSFYFISSPDGAKLGPWMLYFSIGLRI